MMALHSLSRKGLSCYNAVSRFSSFTVASVCRSSSAMISQHYQENDVFNSLPNSSAVYFLKTKNLDLDSHQVNARTTVSKEAASSSQVEQQYKCPSRLLEHFSQLVILDTATSLTTFYDCPVSSGFRDSLEAPTSRQDKVVDSPGISQPAKEAKIIMRIRHKKMKKHKLKKLRKRMYFLWSRQKKARKAKRLAKYYKELEEIKKTGEDFNAESFVKEQLLKARKGGFFINVFDSKNI
nr:hypothetical protein BgiMline_025829 [Biomphalaria glabrata]